MGCGYFWSYSGMEVRKSKSEPGPGLNSEVSVAPPQVVSFLETEQSHPVWHQRIHPLFFDVMAEKADQRCSTFLLPQCGQTTSPSS